MNYKKYTELKEKFLHESSSSKHKKQEKQKKNKEHASKSPLEVAGVQSIRSTSNIYSFLAHHHKNVSSTNNSNKQQSTTPISRDQLLKKLHEKMPYRQKQTENEDNSPKKRNRDKEKTSKDRSKKQRTSVKEWSSTPADTTPSAKTQSPVASKISSSLTFGRFDFGDTNGDKKKTKKKKQQLISTLKKVESEQNDLIRLQEENPEEGQERVHKKHWQTALAKAKGEKIRDNVQLLRKSIKKQEKRREKSSKKWEQTKSQTEKRIKEKQQKRKENIQKRKDAKKAKLKKKMIKKGRLIS